MLGFVLADLGQKNGVTVEESALLSALQNVVREYPGEEKKVFEWYRNNPEAMQQLRAPLFEDAVVRWILAHSQTKTKKIDMKQLAQMEDELSQWGQDESKPAEKKTVKKKVSKER